MPSVPAAHRRGRSAQTRRRGPGSAADPVTIGIDLGGTGIRLLRMGSDGRMVGHPVELPVTDRRHTAVIAQLRDAIRVGYGQAGAVSAVGVGVPGFIQRDRGIVVRSPNFPDWRDVPVRRLLQRGLSVPLVLENDANAAALGEAWLGAGRGRSGVMIMVTLGTGVGGGIVVDGSVLRGRDGMAGEIGHQTVDPDGPRCGCGNDGCLEAYASVTGLVGAYQRRRGRPADGVTGVILARRAREGDDDADAAFREMGRALGITFANLINLFNPRAIVVGGGLARAWSLFRLPMTEEIARRAIRPAAKGVVIRRAQLGTAAGMIGAARAAWQTTEGLIPRTGGPGAAGLRRPASWRLAG